MNNTKNTIAGNGLLVALLVVALIGAAAFGLWYVKKNGAMEALPETAEITTDSTIPSSEPTPEVTTDAENTPVPTTTPETAAAEPVTSTSGDAVKIDIEKAFAPRIIGSADAPIKIIEYASLTCSHCAHFSNDVLPELKTKYIDTGKVQFEFREFPLNDPALKAAITARCLPEDKYEGFISLLFKTQEHWAAGLNYLTSIKQNAKLAGMSDETFDACQADAAIKQKIAANMKEAQDKWKIDATPTFIINDGAEKISGAQPLTEFERIFRKLTNDAVGEAPKVE